MRSPLKALLLRLAPLSFWQHAKFELRMLRVRAQRDRMARRFAGSRDLMINFGAGAKGHREWTNVDIEWKPGINCVCDCRTTLPFADESARLIFNEHFLEHLDYDQEVPHFLRECWRILQPGGTIRVVVPDGGGYLEAYNTDGWNALEALRGLSLDRRDPYFPIAYESRMELINFVFRQHGEHKFAYDAETLLHCLSKAGFASVRRAKFGESVVSSLALDQETRMHESLYVEGVK